MIVIGDVHGCYETLMRLIEKLPHDDLCFVGDLIDRGPDSYKVVKFVRENGYKCVLGNHEEFVINRDNIVWSYNGGQQTIESYKQNCKNWEEELENDRQWFKNLPLYIETENYIISHSSCYDVWKSLPHDSNNFRDRVLWSRKYPTKTETDKTNIIGHTPIENINGYENDEGQKVVLLIDTGCVYGGKLSAIDTETEKIYEDSLIIGD